MEIDGTIVATINRAGKNTSHAIGLVIFVER